MRARMRLLLGVLVLSSAAAIGVSLATDGSARADEGPPSAAQVATALGRDPVYRAPDTSVRLGGDVRAQLEQDVADSPVPLRVAVMGRLPAEVTAKQFAGRLCRSLPDDGRLYVVVYAEELPAFGGCFTHVKGIDTGFVSAVDAGLAAHGSPQQRLLTITGRLSGRLDNPPEFDFFNDDVGTDPPSTHVRVGRVVVLVVVVLLGLGVLGAAGWWLWRRGASGHRSRVLARAVDSGTEADRTIRARRAVLDVGELLDRNEMTSGDDADEWQRALDGYDQAGRLLDRAQHTDQYDQVISLCEAARRHVEAATRGRVPGRGRG